jgi:hypothetical protein
MVPNALDVGVRFAAPNRAWLSALNALEPELQSYPLP